MTRRFTTHQARFVAALELGPAKLVGRTYRAKDGTRLRARTVELWLTPSHLQRVSYSRDTWAIPLGSKLTGYEIFTSDSAE